MDLNKKIISIINNLNVPSKLKQEIVDNIDFIDKRALLNILQTYSQALSDIHKKNAHKKKNLKKYTLNFDIKLDTIKENKNAELLINQLNNTH